LKALFSLFFVSVDDGFCVCAGGKGVAAGSELSSQRREIVDLSVMCYPDGTVFIGERLVTSLWVDDTQASHSQSHVVIEIRSIIVRPPMSESF
jgi:hypothetical protein